MRATVRGRRKRPIATGLVALVSVLLVWAVAGVAVEAATTTKPYTATWVDSNGDNPVSNPPNTNSVSPGPATVYLQITNNASPQSLGSANITVPTGFTLTGGSVSSPGSATPVGNKLQLRNLKLAPAASLVASISVTTPCLADSSITYLWSLRVKQANDFSGPPGNDFDLKPPTEAPKTTLAGGSRCQLRFVNQPNTTVVLGVIKDGVGSTGNPIKVEIFDPATDLVVSSNENVTLTPVYNPAAGVIAGGTVAAAAGVATFSSLSLNKSGPYRLQASSPAASNTPVRPAPPAVFMIVDTLQTCSGTTCNFAPLTDGGSSYSTQPQTGTAGASLAASRNLSGLLISCDFAPFNYPDARQPNAIWYTYSGTGVKNNTIIIDKATVQITPENGASAYQVCFTSPTPFFARGGNTAPGSATITLNTLPPAGTLLPSAYFGETWYIGLLPDCGKKAVAPCVTGRSGSGAGNRTITFITPDGDPGYK